MKFSFFILCFFFTHPIFSQNQSSTDLKPKLWEINIGLLKGPTTEPGIRPTILYQLTREASNSLWAIRLMPEVFRENRLTSYSTNFPTGKVNTQASSFIEGWGIGTGVQKTSKYWKKLHVYFSSDLYFSKASGFDRRLKNHYHSTGAFDYSELNISKVSHTKVGNRLGGGLLYTFRDRLVLGSEINLILIYHSFEDSIYPNKSELIDARFGLPRLLFAGYKW